MLITFPVLGILFNHYPRVSGRRNEQGRQNVSPNTVTETAENPVNSIDQALFQLSTGNTEAIRGITEKKARQRENLAQLKAHAPCCPAGFPTSLSGFSHFLSSVFNVFHNLLKDC